MWVKLTDTENNAICIDLRRVEEIYENGKKGTEIIFDDGTSVNVLEPFRYLKRLMV